MAKIKINFEVDLDDKMLEKFFSQAVSEGLIYKDLEKSVVELVKDLFIWDGLSVYEELMEEPLVNAVTFNKHDK